MNTREVKQVMLRMLQILQGEKFYFSKMIDTFVDRLPETHQRGLMEFIANKVGTQMWIDMSADPYNYRDLLTTILIFYSGGEDTGQPHKAELSRLIAQYVKSDRFTEAEQQRQEVDGDKTGSEQGAGEKAEKQFQANL